MAASEPADKRLTELREALTGAVKSGQPVGILPLADHRAVLAHVPEDMTVRVAAGIGLSELQSVLKRAGQWLPVDPVPSDVTIKEVIDGNLSGPRRCGHGTIREHVIGMEMLLPDGRLISSGGNVVKNVAGYDLQKLFIGAEQSLGIVVTVTFKLLPLPAREAFLVHPCESVAELAELTGRVMDLPLTPVVLDWVRERRGDGAELWLGFAGTDEEVAWQIEESGAIGITRRADKLPGFAPPAGGGARRSVLPSRLGEFVAAMGDEPFIARAANGLVHAAGFADEPPTRELTNLEARLKSTFDPDGILPPLPVS